jgi:DNA mismatch endonuclease (patch repair protein)
MDRIDKQRRSWNMSRIKSKDTRPEIRVRSTLHGMGYRFRLHARALPGRPDIVLPKRRTALFVHGCFWHRHAGCRFAYTPKSRKKFWLAKFAANIARDIKVSRALRQLGWKPVVVWECEIGNPERLVKRLRRQIGP